MQIFVTGASGFIGGRLVDFLAEKGCRVRALEHMNPLRRQDGVEIVHGDIRDAEPWKEALRGTDILFHLAASLGFSRISHQKFRNINARGTENLLRAARDAGVKRILHISSSGVIGIVKNGDRAAEDYPLHPQNIYDRTKLEGERIALRFAADGMNIIVVRPGWVYGPGDRRTFKLIKAIHGRRFALIAPDKGRQTPVYIDDLVQGLMLSAENGKAGQIYHLAGAESPTIREMAVAVAEACSVPLPRLTIPLAPAKIAAWTLEKLFAVFQKEAPFNRSRLGFFIHPKALSIEKARRELAFRPVVDFRTGIKQTVLWYKERGWL